jgi:hypothetical protein
MEEPDQNCRGSCHTPSRYKQWCGCNIRYNISVAIRGNVVVTPSEQEVASFNVMLPLASIATISGMECQHQIQPKISYAISDIIIPSMINRLYQRSSSWHLFGQ